MESFDALGFRFDRFLSFASGLGGRPLALVSPRGGCGNELMLTLFLKVLPTPFTASASFGCGRVEPGIEPAGLRLIDEGVLNPDLGVPGADLVPNVLGTLPVLLRVLLTGKAGNAMFGGPRDGRDGRGSVVVIVSELSLTDMCFEGIFCSQVKWRKTCCGLAVRSEGRSVH